MIRFDVIVPTYNRSHLLAHTLRSLEKAVVPDMVDVKIIVVDNNSDDAEAKRNADIVTAMDSDKFRMITERRTGLSFARNAGICASDADWIGFIDDDERVDPNWLVVAHRHLEPEHVGFISGPYLPNWEIDPPSWLPASIGRYIAVIGWIDLSNCVKEFDRELNATAMGGNVVIKRRWLDTVGLYNTNLGRVRGRLLSSEDHEMHDRLVAAGARGFYVPDLVIHHFIPSSRLTKKYHRHWAFWHGYSMQHLEQSRPQNLPMMLGMPRYLLGNAIRSLPRIIGGILSGGNRTPQTFALELDFVEVVARLYAQLSPSPAKTEIRSSPPQNQVEP